MAEFPDFTTIYEKLGVLGTMLAAVFWLLWYQIRTDGNKTMTPDSLSKRLAGMEENIEKLGTRCSDTERNVERVVERARDFDRWKERWILMWDRHKARTGYREDGNGNGWHDDNPSPKRRR